MNANDLPKPAVYAPFVSGRYSVLPGLSRLGTDFGNGDVDGNLFQIDCEWARFQKSKAASIAECREKYVCVDRFEDGTRRAGVRFMAERLAREWPHLFELTLWPEEAFTLRCTLPGETLMFNGLGDLVSPNDLYADGLDALCRQVQEDVAVLRRDTATGADWLAALHVCHPSRWVPKEKIGKSFAVVHEPVPGMERAIAASASVVRAMVVGPPCVRFVWSIEPTPRLNRHPDAPPGVAPTLWNRRCATPFATLRFYIRVERQTFFGLPDANAAIFAIRLSHVTGDAVRANPLWRSGLRNALIGMNADEQAYKGLDDATIDALLSYLSE